MSRRRVPAPEPVEIVFIRPEQARQYVAELREAKTEHLYGKRRFVGSVTTGQRTRAPRATRTSA